MHPSQEAAARSLGLTRMQALGSVVLPQAVRRVIPPLLNDFIGLQKDTALVGVLGVGRGVQAVADRGAADFNFTNYLVAATLFVAITIPLARFTDWLVARDRRAARPGGCVSDALAISGSTSPSASSRCCAASTSRSPSTRSSA